MARRGPRDHAPARALPAGFTLLEVMITLAILGLSLTAISRSQQNSVRAANRAKWMTIATMLAREKMVEVEDKLFEEGFSEFEEAEKGTFKDEGFERFDYELKVDKVELPANVNGDSLSSMIGGGGLGGEEAEGQKGDKGGKDTDSQQSSMVALGAKMIGQQFEMIRNALEQSIRRVQLKVIWKEARQPREITVVGYFTDPRKIDSAVMGGIGGATGTGGTTGSGGTTGTGGITGTGTGRTGTGALQQATPLRSGTLQPSAGGRR